MNAQPKPVDLKALLDKTERLAQTNPSLASGLFAEYQTQAAHLREIDNRALQLQITTTYLGQTFGLIIGMTAIISGSITAIHGASWAGGVIGGGGVIGLVSVFVLGRRR